MTPLTVSGRILAGAWYFFALILISSYTANLAAFLTVSKINTPISHVLDLAEQTKVTYGTVNNSQVRKLDSTLLLLLNHMTIYMIFTLKSLPCFI